jgi:maltose alpha-D-glucosyltransferase/alpha-amylase
VRQLGTETILVVNNLSSAAQAVELDLRRYKGNILIEMFGRNIFPRVGELPYLLTLGPYQFYWFRLRRI